MKLVIIKHNTHLASSRGVTVNGIHVPTAACNSRKWLYEFAGNPCEFEGSADQVTCKRCLAKLAKRSKNA